jgi:Fe-S cluster assembly iron-binding protein IscA
MGIEITAEAAEVLRRSLQLAKIDPASDGGVRLRAAKALGGGFEIQVELAAGASSGEMSMEKDGVKVFVDPSVTEIYPNAVVAVGPEHERIVVRPSEV